MVATAVGAMPYKLARTASLQPRPSRIVPVDIDSDGSDELLLVNNEVMSLIHAATEFEWQLQLPKPWVDVRCWAGRFGTAGEKALVLTRTRADTHEFGIVRLQGPKPHDFRFHRLRCDGQQYVKVAPKGTLNVDGVGGHEIVLAVDCGYEKQVRGLVAFDGETGSELWHFWIGPQVRQVITVDIDNDGTEDVLVSTYAPDNGLSANGMSDGQSYVFALDRRGGLLWVFPVGGRFTGSILRYVARDSEGHDRVYIASYSLSGGAAEAGRIWALDARTGQVNRSWVAGKTQGMVSADLDLDGFTEVIAGNADGGVRVFDAELTVRRQVRFPSGALLLGVENLGGDARPEVIVAASDTSLLILDARLRMLAEPAYCNHRLISEPENIPDRFSLVASGPHKELLMSTSNALSAWGMEITRFALVRVPPSLSWGVLVAVACSLLALASATVHSLLRSNRYEVNILVRSLVKGAGVVRLKPSGRVVSLNRPAQSILGLTDSARGREFPLLCSEKMQDALGNFVSAGVRTLGHGAEAELALTTPGGNRNLLARLIRLRNALLLTLEDISSVEYLRRIQTWVPVAQKLAHCIKNPLGTIMGAVEQIETKVEDDRVKKYVGYVKDEVARLKKMTDAFMRFTKLNPPELRPRDVNELVCKVVAKYEGALAKGVLLELNLDDKLPSVALDEEGIGNVLDIVIENAIEAMPAAVGSRQHTANRTLRIRTLPETVDGRQNTANRPAGVRVEVEDTGLGIPQKYLDKVFEPYFTHGKPDGTGLGLALAKKIVEDHKGRIEVESREGTGTTVTVTLPAEKRADA